MSLSKKSINDSTIKHHNFLSEKFTDILNNNYYIKINFKT